MLSRKWTARLLIAFLCCCLLPVTQASAATSDISTSSVYMLMYPNQKTVWIGEEAVEADPPPTIIDGSMYLPAAFVGKAMGFDVTWNGENRTITMTPPGHRIILSPDADMIYADNASFPFSPVAAIIDGSTMVKLTWIRDYLDATVTYNAELNRVEILYIRNADPLLIERTGNSRPVAKFTTGKPVYKIGEPVHYIDLSYDPDSEGLPKYIWTGKEEAFFSAGEYPVTLQVVDGHGNKSDIYRTTVTVSDEVHLSRTEYPIYMKPTGTFIKLNGWDDYYNQYEYIPELSKQTTNLMDRLLLVSDSPEEVKEQGYLYQDKVDGKARLYADHVNGTIKNLTFAILARNTTDHDVKIRTTNKGEVYPSIYANLIGNEATVDFLLGRKYDEVLTVPAGQTVVYSKMPTLYPGQGINVLYDIETDGEVEITFAASESPVFDSFKSLKMLYTDDHLRGTFPISGVKWNVDMPKLEGPARLPLGNGKSDPFVMGTDATRNKPVQNFGNWGVSYHIHIDNPPKMTLMVMAKGGIFKGPFKVNGEMVLVPQSGVITAFDGLQIIGRTTGKEASLDIEYSPPAGSFLPVDLVFYPLRDLP